MTTTKESANNPARVRDENMLITAPLEAELVDDSDERSVQLSIEDAKNITSQIRQVLNSTYALIIQAYLGRAWSALGYRSWGEYCDTEFDNLPLQPPKDIRHEVVMAMRTEGHMSARAIASATKISKSLVGLELRKELEEPGVHDWTPTPEKDVDTPPAPLRIVGTDGKSYPVQHAVKPAKVKIPAHDLDDSVLDLPPSAVGIDLVTEAPRRAPRVRMAGLSEQLLAVIGPQVLSEPADEVSAEDQAHLGRLLSAISQFFAKNADASASLDQLERERLRSNVQDSADALNSFLDRIATTDSVAR